MPLPNGIIILREGTLLYEMITNLSTNFLMEKIQIIKSIDGNWS